MAKKVGIDYLSVLEYIVLGNYFPSFILGGEFVKYLRRFDYLKKLSINEHSFIIFVMKLVLEIFNTFFFAAL